MHEASREQLIILEDKIWWLGLCDVDCSHHHSDGVL